MTTEKVKLPVTIELRESQPVIVSDAGLIVARCHRRDEANEIVLALNSQPALLAVAEKVLAWFEADKHPVDRAVLVTQLRAAIKLAGKEI